MFILKFFYCFRNCYFSNHELRNYQSRVEYLAKVETSSFNSFKRFLQGPSHKEFIVLNSIKDSIEKYLKNLGGILAEYAHGWKSFGSKNKMSNEFYFTDTRFTRIMSHQFEFRKEFSKTQLLACYFDERKNDYENFCRLRRGRSATFLASWIYYRWQLRSKTKNLNKIGAIAA